MDIQRCSAKKHKAGADGSRTRNWKTLYEAALCETKACKLPQRIFHAELAVNNRLAELVFVSDSDAEKDSLTHALYALRELRTMKNSAA